MEQITPTEKFNYKAWTTVNAYDGNSLSNIPQESAGIYLFAAWGTLSPNYGLSKPQVLYVGMSNSLFFRCRCHPVRNRLAKRFEGIVTYFNTFNPFLVRELERYFIREYNPRFNLVHRDREAI